MRKKYLFLLALAASFSVSLLSCQQTESKMAPLAQNAKFHYVTIRTSGKNSVKRQQSEDNAALQEKKKYGSPYVAVFQLDYRSFQDAMTDEEWGDFTLYFPILKDEMPFEWANWDSQTPLDRDGRVTAWGEWNTFYQYTPDSRTDIREFAERYNIDDTEYGKIMEVLLFDLDGDGIRELILQWTPRGVGDYLILHYEEGNYYGLLLPMRGFFLQASGVYTSGSGGNHYYRRLRFEDGDWIAESLAVYTYGSAGPRYYIDGEIVDEDTFSAYTKACETGDATVYYPKERREGDKINHIN